MRHVDGADGWMQHGRYRFAEGGRVLGSVEDQLGAEGVA